ncbi:hypothetical protein BDB00DRAFT_875477 [Zychaea mexicana]|uniref:uncharacterized protein n=1 Tax=Zychaea mexicana TaxID=64656 RepID=UPI0022FF4105|nr:uncharacterized protein BDB00DRAFT_875477 [Zychaea mexicana]KAI9490282.1 hypothetical protein BDB00DRAFT_875477 [Zychaea mexicana]
MNYYYSYYYIVYDPRRCNSQQPAQQQSITQLSLHKLWQGEKLNIGLRRQVLVRNTLLTCLLAVNDDDENNKQDRIQEETWLDACFNDLEQDEQEVESDHHWQYDDEDIKNIADDTGQERRISFIHPQGDHHQKRQQEQRLALPTNTAEHQRRQILKSDASYWRWHL